MSSVDEPLKDYRPRPAPLFWPSKIVLAKGSNRTDGRRRLAEQICAAYPDAEVVEAFDTPHNRVNLGTTDPLQLHERGKRTLVLGEHRSAVRFSDEGGNACPNYWHFSPYGFCPYGCHYCYLAGTPGVWFLPTVKVFLNLEEILAEVDQTASRLGHPVRAVVMPIIPVANWQVIYGRFLLTLLDAVPLTRITLGSICSYSQAQRLMELKLGKQNAISTLLRGLSQFSSDENGTAPFGPAKSDDGRLRFSRSIREEVYRYLSNCIRRHRPDLEIGLCLEDESMFASLALQESIGRCNCVL